MQIRNQFDYRPKILKTVALFLAVFAGAVVLTYFAITLDQPIQNARGFRLTQNQARIICGLFAVLSPIGLYFIGSTVCAAFSSPQQLILTGMEIENNEGIPLVDVNAINSFGTEFAVYKCDNNKFFS